MVAYQPPDQVIASIGSSFPSALLLDGAERILPLMRRDRKGLTRFGIADDLHEVVEEWMDEIEDMMADARAKKHDTALQMSELVQLMGRVRGWLRTLRLIAGVNLALDAPALNRLVSAEPEMAEGYARDMLEDLRVRLKAVGDLKDRLQDAGLTREFVSRGSKFARLLSNAVGAKDVDPTNLNVFLRRFYLRKGQLYMELKRTCRAAHLAFAEDKTRVERYHLKEIEPVIVEPVFRPSR